MKKLNKIVYKIPIDSAYSDIVDFKITNDIYNRLWEEFIVSLVCSVFLNVNSELFDLCNLGRKPGV